MKLETRQILIYILSIAIYFCVVYFLNRNNRKKKVMYGVSIVSIVIFLALQIIGKKNQIYYLGSESFMNTYLRILYIVMNIPILYGGYKSIELYTENRNFAKNKATAIKVIVMLILIVLIYLSFGIWDILYYYFF
jgi:hypothetical protein